VGYVTVEGTFSIEGTSLTLEGNLNYAFSIQGIQNITVFKKCFKRSAYFCDMYSVTYIYII